MKKTILLSLITVSICTTVSAQGIGDLIKKNTKKDSTGKSGIGKVLDKIPGTGTSSGSGLSNDDIVSGLKEALRVGTDSSAKRLSKMDGFFGDAAIKILMPDEAKKVESSLRNMGMGSLVDKAILSMNRAAEDAASGIMAMGSEKLPIVKKIEENVFCCVRMSGMGVALAPEVADQVIALMDKKN